MDEQNAETPEKVGGCLKHFFWGGVVRQALDAMILMHLRMKLSLMTIVNERN